MSAGISLSAALDQTDVMIVTVVALVVLVQVVQSAGDYLARRSGEKG